MAKKTDINPIIHSDGSGKLYIKSSDFFRQEKVRDMVSAIMESNIFKKITKR
jgi:hypothetical protein